MNSLEEAIDKLTMKEALLFSEQFFNDEFSMIYMEASEKPIEVTGLKAKMKRIIHALAKLIQTIIQLLQKGAKNISERMTKKIKDLKIRQEVKSIRKQLELQGDRMVMFMDVWQYESVFCESVIILSKYVDTFMKSYEKKGKGLIASTNFLKKCTETMDSYQKKLDQIKTEKKEFKASKVLKWVNLNVDEKGYAKGVMKRYMADLERTKKRIDEVEVKLDTFLDKNDYIRDPEGFSQFMHNTTRYVCKNADWLGMYAISSISFLTKILSKGTLKASYRKQYLTAGGKVSDDINTEVDDDNADIAANLAWKDKTVKAKRKTIHKASKVIASGSFAIGTKLKGDSIENRRNSI